MILSFFSELHLLFNLFKWGILPYVIKLIKRIIFIKYNLFYRVIHNYDTVKVNSSYKKLVF